jgi:hypothetical protein
MRLGIFTGFGLLETVARYLLCISDSMETLAFMLRTETLASLKAPHPGILENAKTPVDMNAADTKRMAAS